MYHNLNTIEMFVNCFNTTIDMLNDRKYIAKSDKLSSNDKDYVLKLINDGNECRPVLSGSSSLDELLLIDVIIHMSPKKLGKKEIDLILENITETKHIILITIQKNTPCASKCILELSEIRIEHFLLKELSINITKHIYQPKFKLLTKEEIKEVLETFSCKPINIKKILISDAVCKYYDAKKKDVFRIEKYNTISYLIVV